MLSKRIWAFLIVSRMFLKAATAKIKNIANINVKLILNNYLVFSSTFKAHSTIHLQHITTYTILYIQTHIYTWTQHDPKHGPFGSHSNDNTTRPVSWVLRDSFELSTAVGNSDSRVARSVVTRFRVAIFLS